MNIIGKIIRETRVSKGLTQEDLAMQSKVNLRTIQRIENNESDPRRSTLDLICEALHIDVEEVVLNEHFESADSIGIKIMNLVFLIILNLILMSIIGYLSLDSEANINSRVGAYLLSFFMPFFIAFLTPRLSGLERMLKYGFGFIIYILMIIILHGFPTGFVTGLIPCLTLSLGVLYFGNDIIKIDQGVLMY